MNSQSKLAEEPEGTGSLASAAAPPADVCAICHESEGLDFETDCCGHKMHLPCIMKWAHGTDELPARHNCPCCRADMDLSSPTYNTLDDEDSPWFRANPKTFRWNEDEHIWNYTGPFPQFQSYFPLTKGKNVIPEEARNGMNDAEFVISWNTRDRKENGDKRKIALLECQCGLPCGNGAYVVADPTAAADPNSSVANNEAKEYMIREHGYKCDDCGNCLHPSCYERYIDAVEKVKTYTNNFQLNASFPDVMPDNTRLSTLLDIVKPKGNIRYFRKECPDCKTATVYLHDHGRLTQSLSDDGWERVRFKGEMVCKACAEKHWRCKWCSSLFPKAYAFTPNSQDTCYPCGVESTNVNFFVNGRDGWRDGARFDIPKTITSYGYARRDTFISKLNDYSPKEWTFHPLRLPEGHYLNKNLYKTKPNHPHRVVLCNTEKSKGFISAIVTLQRTYRKKAWKFVRTFSRNFTPGTYPAAKADMVEEALQMWTPEGLHWNTLQCTCDPCVGWSREADDGFEARTVLVLSDSRGDMGEKYGWRYFEAGDEVCPCCYDNKKELARTFTNGFKEAYYDFSALPEGLSRDELGAILEDEGLHMDHVKCHTYNCDRGDCFICKDDTQDFACDNGWYKNKYEEHLCPTCSQNYVCCVECDEDSVPINDVKYFQGKNLCEECYGRMGRAYAVTIQRHVRGFLLRQKALRHKAAVTIQRICRGHIARKRMKILMEAIVEYVRKESRGTMVLKEGVHDFPECSVHWCLLLNDPEFEPKRFMELFLQPYFAPETYIECGALFCEHCHSVKCFISYQYGYTGYVFGWEVSTFYATHHPLEFVWITCGNYVDGFDYKYLDVKPSFHPYAGKLNRLICPDCIRAHFTACRVCSKSYYPKDLTGRHGRCPLCLEVEASDASKRIQRAFRSYMRRKLYIAVRDAYKACCTFTDKFKPGLYRDDHCLSSFLKLMPSVEYLKKYDYVACSCDDRCQLNEWVYIFDNTGTNYVSINKEGHWQCQKCSTTTTASKKRAATDASEGETLKRARSNLTMLTSTIQRKRKAPLPKLTINIPKP